MSAGVRGAAHPVGDAQGAASRDAGGAGAAAVRPESEAAGLDEVAVQARGFGRARQARAAERIEDYAELIDDLARTGGPARATDIARRLGVSHVTAVKALARLECLGLAVCRPHRGVTLTQEGSALAARVRARHRLVLDLLLALGVPAEDAKADAEGIEHHVSPATLAAFGRFLRSDGEPS